MIDWLFISMEKLHVTAARNGGKKNLLALKRHRKHTIPVKWKRSIESVTTVKLQFRSWTRGKTTTGQTPSAGERNVTRRHLVATSFPRNQIIVDAIKIPEFPQIHQGKWKKLSECIILWSHSRGKPYQTQSVVILEATCWCYIIFSHLKPLPCIKPLSCPAIYIWDDCSHSRAVSYSINSIPPVSSISRSFHHLILSLSLSPRSPLFSLPINSS